MEVVGIVPARMAASRFPGKPLALIHGRPMIEHLVRRAWLSKTMNQVVVATCDGAIQKAVEGFGGTVIMTADTHVRATDRIAEAARKLDADVVVNIQGDEPMLRPEMLDLLCAPLLEDPALPCSNLMMSIDGEADFRDPNQVKVVCNQRGEALYMSREPIPTTHYLGFEIPRWKQLGLIAFTKDFLLTFAQLAPTPLERAESVDMMRAIEHGYRVKMVVSPYVTYAVDTPEDLARVEMMMANDELLKQY
jgi:3-deoxy-manno-octulosonate cytidylyltransferase (CMP-KDO synthetase)